MSGPTGDGPQPSGVTTTSSAAPSWTDVLVAERDRLHRFVTSLAGHDPYHVEDVVQETLLRAWQLREELDWRERPIRMWLFRVARNLVIDGWRKDRVTPVGISAADFPEPLAVADPATLAVDRHMLVDALRGLAPVHREVVVHVHMVGTAGAEVARLLGVPRGTVKSRSHHGLRMLRRHFEGRQAAA
ncbi:sigma-70 family RNA polymerase sigma factor [Planotetraspora phitsanulokensis]|uniref:RNA polymerase sigma factor n=1 Tax=Planotetraspora phitsanulokensis TaxID=575192 RepID=A0A8J3UBB2_9ACTN|nr:sigma-70 family RNA polymerase sigma factor [Planotetraspora phitsanulokensis]GII42038.1 RNA polymerase sigma factor [Planotetraspora phitsanulokensis]